MKKHYVHSGSEVCPIGPSLLRLITCTDAKIFYRLENWQPDQDDAFVTLYVRKAGMFQRAVSKATYRIAGGSEERANAAFAPPKSLASRSQIGQTDVSCSTDLI